MNLESMLTERSQTEATHCIIPLYYSKMSRINKFVDIGNRVVIAGAAGEGFF